MSKQVSRLCGLGASGVLLLLFWAGGCTGSRNVEKPPDDRFGHRFEESVTDGREVLAISPPDTAHSYFYYPAVFDTVHVRPAPFDPARPAAGQQVPVEVLVKGTLPDACTELHSVEQRRAGHILTVSLQMRRPRGAVCANVVRPYRFYLLLEGLFGAGDYTLKFEGSGRVFAFELTPPRGN